MSIWRAPLLTAQVAYSEFWAGALIIFQRCLSFIDKWSIVYITSNFSIFKSKVRIKKFLLNLDKLKNSTNLIRSSGFMYCSGWIILIILYMLWSSAYFSIFRSLLSPFKIEFGFLSSIKYCELFLWFVSTLI